MEVCHRFQGARGHISARTGHPEFDLLEHMPKIQLDGSELFLLVDTLGKEKFKFCFFMQANLPNSLQSVFKDLP